MQLYVAIPENVFESKYANVLQECIHCNKHSPFRSAGCGQTQQILGNLDPYLANVILKLCKEPNICIHVILWVGQQKKALIKLGTVSVITRPCK